MHKAFLHNLRYVDTIVWVPFLVGVFLVGSGASRKEALWKFWLIVRAS
jgi:hypothetical protein